MDSLSFARQRRAQSINEFQVLLRNERGGRENTVGAFLINALAFQRTGWNQTHEAHVQDLADGTPQLRRQPVHVARQVTGAAREVAYRWKPNERAFKRA
jgi:hypothetical protein